MIRRVGADEFGGGFAGDVELAGEDEAAVLISFFDGFGFFIHECIPKVSCLQRRWPFFIETCEIRRDDLLVACFCR